MRKSRVFAAAALAASLACAGDESPESPAARWAALLGEYQTAHDEYYRPYREAKSDAERAAVKRDPAQAPDLLFRPRFREFAAEHAGTEDAVPALTMLLRIGTSGEEVAEVTRTLLEKHATSERIGDAVLGMRDAAALRTILGKSPVRAVRGLATYRLAWLCRKERPEEALALYEVAAKEYGDVVLHGRRTLGEVAEGVIHEARQLAVGKKAPEIEGTDLEGKPMKLSEFRGKVVLLDFWGDW